MSKLKINFKVTVPVRDELGNPTEATQDIKLSVIKPTYLAQQKAKKIHNKVFKEALESGAMLRAKVDSYVREQNLWDDIKAQRLSDLATALIAGETRLAKGGISLKEAKETALTMRLNRDEYQNLLSVRQLIDQKTAEAQAEDSEFDFLVSCCTLYETGQPYFKSYEDYLEQKNEDYAFTCASKFALLYHKLAENYYMKLPENKFLKQYEFINDDGRLVDKEGHFVDALGRRIDNKGFFINDEGQRIDSNNIPVDEDGNYVFTAEFQPFTDDDGNPVVTDKVVATAGV